MDSRTELFITMGILPFFSQYIFFLLFYMVNNKHLIPNNLAVHNNDIRSANNVHLPFTNLTKYQKCAYYEGIKIFNHLPTHIKCAANGIQVFNSALKSLLLSNSFYFFRNILILIKNIYFTL